MRHRVPAIGAIKPEENAHESEALAAEVLSTNTSGKNLARARVMQVMGRRSAGGTHPGDAGRDDQVEQEVSERQPRRHPRLPTEKNERDHSGCHSKRCNPVRKRFSFIRQMGILPGELPEDFFDVGPPKPERTYGNRDVAAGCLLRDIVRPENRCKPERRENDALHLPEHIKEPAREHQLERHDVGHTDDRRIIPQQYPPDRVPRMTEITEQLRQIMPLHWYLGNDLRVELAESVECGDAAGHKKTVEERGIPNQFSWFGRDGQGQLDNRVGQPFVFGPLFSDERVQAKRGENQCRKKSGPDENDRQPGIKILRQVKA